MENLVVSIFNTESEAYQSFADLKAFRQTQTTKVAQIALVKNENGHIVEKERYDFEDSTTDATLDGGLLGAVIGLLGGPIGVLFGYGIGSLNGLAAGDTIYTAETGLIDVVSQKLTNGETAVVALVQEDNEAVIDAYFTKYDTQIVRWDVATVVAEIEAALQVQEDLYNQARAQMKAERKAERKAKLEEFKANVMDYFVDEYLHGRTPNPCIACNRYVKWESLLQRSLAIGADYIATGHYARIEQLPNGRYAIRNSVTAAKDQTYALYNLTQEQLKRTLMPVGEYSKDQIRVMAEKIGLPTAHKKDSQEICFVDDNDYAGFIDGYGQGKVPEGNFVDKDGKVLGRHKGITRYTIGQRKGLNIALGKPVFVQKICPETNEVVLGSNEDLFTTTVRANRLNFMAVEDIPEEIGALGKIRYNHRGDTCKVKRIGEDLLECHFDTPVRAVTPGQALVLYQGEYVLGGGTIA